MAVLSAEALSAVTVSSFPDSWPVTFRSPATESVTLPFGPAFTRPEIPRLPLATLIAMAPLLVLRLPLTARPFSSLTVNVEPAPVTFATSVLTFVLRAVLFWAVTLSTLPLT